MADAQPQSSGSKSILGFELPRDGNKKPVPKWVPVTLLAFSTVAMTVPIVLLLRHRAATVGKRLADAPPPPRRTTSSKGIALANPNPSLFSVKDSVISSAEASTSSAPAMAKAGDNFNGALHCAKAFCIATMAVGAGAMASVWGIRQYMGVETTQEFADRMRLAILSRMPVLSARIHRPPAPEDGDALLPPEPVVTAEPELASLDAGEEWTWAAAESRLKEAFDKHGFYGWAAAAMRELEAEGRLERSKRGHV
ncbi:hypothetical protein L226DRAFT_511716 [Lentinus tigrinus ALCF2SS1-7]|uniref:Uncharacterized protein n=1 Tax=Lentinus tigrinus ALCF2SS1-6 TaxID=1328759 RepID=A0A5C2RX60_9APHY|nr:hypothetical protein L227DRAFT_603463 [Lentinus tigrinus ALCF2SS1-6]RPD72579.1 hypothetical protein L226DRAFT_511716 [Lentinus tigrinus ALCF2SS1-7]